MKTEEILVDEHKAAKKLNQGVQTLRNNRHKRRGISYVKLGRSVRYSLADINSYIKAHRIIFDSKKDDEGDDRRHRDNTV